MADFPDFKNDEEMAAWFEANNVSADDLEPADEVAFSPDLVVSLVSEIYSVASSSHNRPATAAAASSADANLELEPALP